MPKKIGRYVLAYGLWVLILALGIWAIVLSQTTFSNAMNTWYVVESTAHTGQIEFFWRFFVLGIAIVWIVMMIFTESYFRNGARKGQIFQRFTRVLTFEMLWLFIADFVLLLAQGLPRGVWLRWIIIIAELGLSMASYIFSRSAPGIFADLRKSD